jgi:hypothetical protein
MIMITIMILPFSATGGGRDRVEMNVVCTVLPLRGWCGGRNGGQAQKRISKEFIVCFTKKGQLQRKGRR